MDDPIIEELHDIREQIAAESNHDLNAMTKIAYTPNHRLSYNCLHWLKRLLHKPKGSCNINLIALSTCTSPYAETQRTSQ
jgi:hypothetical protein